MTRRFVFVTQDFEGLHGGGAGPLIGSLARGLDAGGHRVQMVLASPDADQARGEGYEVLPVATPEPNGSIAWFLDRSRMMAERLGGVVAEGDPIDLVEFTDFDAPALWALIHRQELGLDQTRIGIRLHGPVEAITAAIGSAPPPMDSLGELERLALPMADAVLVPSAAVGEWARTRYGLEADRIVVAPPAVPEVSPVTWSPAPAPEFVTLGRLSEPKGMDLLVRAMLPIFEAHPSSRLVLIGADGWSAVENRPMSEVLARLIPGQFADRVEFVGPLPRDEALHQMSTAWAVVVASRFESFCLAAHEARRAGLPVVVPDLPAFRAYRRGAGFMMFDGSLAGLTGALSAIAADRAVAEALVADPAPEVGDPIEPYLGDLPPVRHPRSQAGLATAAVHRLDRITSTSASRWGTLARGVLRMVPAPLARLLVRVAPARLKDRFRTAASWPAEQARRGAVQRRAAIRRRIDAGEYPHAAPPDVTVVIPCFEQGAWVTEAVLSVFEQEHPSWEIVLVDDGSTDPATVGVLDGLSEWPRVRLIRQENRGLSAARNAGMAIARGEFVVPLDADDEIAPGFLSTLLRALQGRPDAAFAHCWAELFGDVHAVWVTRPHNAYWERCSNSVIGCVLLRREAWGAVGGYDETMRDGNEDWELWVRLAAAGWDQVRVMQPLFRYRKHGETMSVATESQFERGTAQVRQRHPGLYAAEALRETKQRWYPALTVVTDDAIGQAPEDVELVPGPPDRAIVASFGKYVADRRGAIWPLSVAMSLVERLEAEPDAAWAGDDASGTVVWRRWSLVDPGAEPRGGVGGADAVPEGELQAGAYPDPEWMVDETLVPDGARLLRHRPEEDGLMSGAVS
ncbi:MAG TPA: glycosyltransferase [Acidimicrobiia bacterium]